MIVRDERLRSGLALRRLERADSSLAFTLGPSETKDGDIVYYFTRDELVELADAIEEIL